MGLTERHWFEDEEPELTENQLEDILWENNKIFERGYQKGFSDGKSAILREQEAIPVVRCKDCKYSRSSHNIWCIKGHNSGGHEFFCAYGERRTEDA